MSTESKRFDRLSTEFDRRVQAVAADRWDAPSPCTEWTARDVLAHVIESCRRMPAAVGIEVGLTSSVTDDPKAAWAEARAAMQEILADPDRAGRQYEGMFGPTSLQATVDSFLGFDLVVHAWDIARATGQDETMPASDVHETLLAAEQMGDNLRRPGVCGPAVPVPAGASEQDRLLGLLGRRP